MRRARSALPLWLWIPAGVALALVVLPIIGLLVRTDLTRFPSLVTSPPALTALWLSLRTAVAATLLCALIGLPLATMLARGTGRLVRLFRAVVLLPLVLPPVVGGLALLYVFGRSGFAGEVIYWLFGQNLPYTTTAVVMAQTFVAMPFLVVSLEGALRTTGEGYELVAATLGARPWTIFRRVTVPLLLPALGSGMVLSFARALGEFGATVTFAGSSTGITKTLPLYVVEVNELDVDSAVAMSLLLVIVAVLVIALARPRALEGQR